MNFHLYFDSVSFFEMNGDDGSMSNFGVIGDKPIIKDKVLNK